MTAQSGSVSVAIRAWHKRLAGAVARLEPHHWLLAAIVLLGLTVRTVMVLGRIDIVYPDEIFQYTEQAHRLVFGSGVVPWEYIVGVRSWLLPGFIAAVMGASSWIGDNPLVYIQALRLMCAALSLVVIVAGFRIADRAAGPVWASLAALLCAVWYQAIFFAPSMMGEVVAAFLMFPAIVLAETKDDEGANAIVLGFLLGLAFCFRFHMAPALFVIAIWYARTDWRTRWLPMLATASGVVFLLLGVLDYLTLGSPFQSVWLNFDLNALKGVSDQFGQASPFAYLYWLAWPDNLLAVPLVLLVVAGAVRAPLLASTAFVVVLSHSLIAHKEMRFICFAVMAIPILLALGTAACTAFVSRVLGEKPGWFAASALTIFLVAHSGYVGTQVSVRYPNDGVLNAFLAAHDQPNICGLGVAGVDWRITGGYTYFNRNVPLYFDDFGGAARVVLGDQELKQYPGQQFLASAGRYNYLIARGDRAIADFAPVACFASASPNGARACLMHRPGGC